MPASTSASAPTAAGDVIMQGDKLTCVDEAKLIGEIHATHERRTVPIRTRPHAVERDRAGRQWQRR